MGTRRLHPTWCGLAVALVCTLTLGIGPVLAGPAMKVVKDFQQPDGTTLELRLWGDEFDHGWETLDGYTVAQDPTSGYWEYATHDETGRLVPSGSRVGLDAPPEPPRLRTRGEALKQSYQRFGVESPFEPRLPGPPAWVGGNTNVLVILVQFPADPGDPDGAQPAVDASFTAAQMEANLFGLTPTGPGNMTDYYNEISYGALNLIGTVVGPYTVAHDKNDYDDGPKNAKDMVKEAIQLADADIDFAPFDNDNDGEVDHVAVAYAGGGPDNGVYDGVGATDNLWPHASSIGAVNVDGGARTVSQYYIAAELLNNTPIIRTIGVYAHELGHKIGLPDLYDTDNSSEGIGHWGLMGSGSWCSNVPGSENGEAPSHMTPWSKWFQGWLTPTPIGAAAMNLPQVETNAFAGRLLSNPGGAADWPGGSGEYFLVENRQQTGFDIGIDGCGILIWHMDESLTTNKNEGHTAGSHRLVDLEEADGLNGLDGSSRGDAGDPFPGTTNNTLWTDNTSPHARLYDGTATGIRLALGTTVCAPTMTVKLNETPIADAGSDVLAECKSSSGTPVMLDGTGSSDPDGDTISYMWSPSGLFDDPTSPQPTGTFPLGVTAVTLTVSDGFEDDTDVVNVEIVDTTPPMVTCPGNITVECADHCGTPANDPQLTDWWNGFSSSDICDDDLDITWTNDLACFPLGTTTVTYKAEDDSGNMNQCSVDVTVVDTTPPDITIALSRDVLWPPNHKMVEIWADVEVTDICDPDPTWYLLSITSSEDDNGQGDGNTVNDIQGASTGTEDEHFELRSERQGRGDGRKYTITYYAVDASDNDTTGVACVRVPHDQSGHAMASIGFGPDGLTFDPSFDLFTVVITSKEEVTEVKGNKVVVVEPAFDATAMDPRDLYVGNTKGAARAMETRIVDVNQDGLEDLAVFFDIEIAEILKPGLTTDNIEGSYLELDGHGALGMHYRTADGRDFLVDNVLNLGEPVPIFTFVPLVPIVEPGKPDVPVALPKAPGIRSIYPNPFNPTTTIAFYLAESEAVTLRIYDATGQLVRTLQSGLVPAGEHRMEWNGRDDHGSPVATGVYFAQLVTPTLQSTKKLVMIK